MRRDVAFAVLSLSMLAAGCAGTSRSIAPLPATGDAAGNLSIVRAAQLVSPAAGDDWPTFARDEQRQSYETLQTAVTKATVSHLVLRWTYPAPSTAAATEIQASPIVVNGVVYVVDIDGVVTALDANTGAAKWHYTLPNSHEVKMTPALYDGILFVASFDTSYSNSTYYFTALDPASGRLLWTQKVPSGVHGSPVAVNGTIYVPLSIGDEPQCHAGGIYAFDEKTGAPVGTPWFTSPGTANGGGIWSSLTYDGLQLYYGTGNVCQRSVETSNAIVALTPQATSDTWDFNTANPLSDDDVGGSVLRVGHTALAIGKNGYVYRLNAITGQLVWSRSLGAPDGAGAFATPSYFGSGASATIIVGAGYVKNPNTQPGNSGGRLYGLFVNGATRWQVDTQSPIFGAVAVTPDLAFTQLDTNVDALDPATGDVLWSYPAEGYFYASPAIVPSGLFAADESGHVYAFGVKGTAAVMPSALTRAQILGIQRLHPPQPHRNPAYCPMKIST